MLQTGYACGLRASELLTLKVADIDSSRMLLWVRHAKGNKDRGMPLSEALLPRLRDHWRRWWWKRCCRRGVSVMEPERSPPVSDTS
jgi:integrase